MEDFKISDEVALEFGKYLKEIRERKGISTNKVELLTNIKKADLSRIENGKKKVINAFYLKEFARIYKLDVLDLHKRLGFIDERVANMNKRERIKHEEFLEGANFYFNDESVTEEEKEKLINSLNSMYFRAKDKKQERKAKREKEKK